MDNKCYAVVTNEKKNEDHTIERFGKQSDADKVARKKKGKLYKYDQPLGIGEDHRKGRLIADYSTK
jgi:hypothetical protein